ncbi:AMP-dependent synthetase [Kribbella antibiotica]|uniref:AMP-dependent synthetase n=1 Tax=Kribbella antibiotica TaxID=190195 RepID=A0A4V6PEA5_9ACTN|nr:AMP-binding protein [Kribbella antibiotica]TDD62507.1 AMP-dependent synthetase [Kribbella antibiotica]
MITEDTVGSLLRHAAEQAPSTVALVEGTPTDRRRWRYSELLAESEQVAQALLGRFAHGERIAVWANNLPEWTLLEMAAGLAGLTLVTVNPALREREVVHVLRQSRSAGIFLIRQYRDNPMLETLLAIRNELPDLREVLLFEDWKSFRETASPTQVLPTVHPDDPAQIQYTSGTTGAPKGAVLRHRGITNNARLSYVRAFDMQPGEVFINTMPLFHTAGCVQGTLAPLISLGTQVLLPGFDPALHLHLIESERGAQLGAVPTMLLAILGHPAFKTTDLSSVRYAVSGGATVAPELVRRVEAELGVPLAIVYAQTEASPVITMTELDDTPEDRSDTIGRPLPGAEVKIVRPSDGELAAADEVGELWTRGYHVMAGYFEDPVQTAAALGEDGWLRTGDLASMDTRGYCRIEGRLKEVIIRGGENIYPREIEQLIATHPSVADVAVVGVPDDHWGEQVAAFVRPVGPVSIAELEEFLHGRLARHKVPKVWRVVEEFPTTASGKIQKFALRNQLDQPIASPRFQ